MVSFLAFICTIGLGLTELIEVNVGDTHCPSTSKSELETDSL